MKALQDIALNKMLMIDIETVSVVPEFNMLPDEMQDEWAKPSRSKNWPEGVTPEQHFRESAALDAVFGKIVCISIGKFSQTDEAWKIETKSFADTDERSLLTNFTDDMNTVLNNRSIKLVGHNLKGFDIPYMCRRLLINGISLPILLDISGDRPWNIHHVDTSELWRFTDYRSASLALLAHVFGLPNPKEDMDGSQVGRVFWEEKDLDRIEEYCEGDVRILGELILRFMGIQVKEIQANEDDVPF